MTSTTGLLVSMNTGNKKLIKKDLKKRYKTLGLLHLFTPSGLHLYPISRILQLFVPKRLYSIFCIFTYLFFSQFQGFYSLKRIISLKFFYELNISKQNCFTLSFLIDYLVGNYHASPLSFTFSYLFLGIVLFSKGKAELIYSLYFAQALIAHFFMTPFYFLAPILGFFLSSLFTFLFPFVFLDYWFFYNWGLSTRFEYFLDGFNNLVICFSNFISHIPPNFPEIDYLLALLVILLRKPHAMILLILISSSPLSIHHEKSISKSVYRADFQQTK